MTLPVRDPDRLARLVDAVLSVGSDLLLPHVLRRIVEAAVDLVDARYGALGVLHESGLGLAEFITVGVSGHDIAAIGDLPEGHGILGVLIVDPRPLRLPDLTKHPDSFGFPPNHPPMSSFLGVPITIRDQVFGNLYLTEKNGSPEFSDEDEALAVSLARAAAIAIDNARLHARVSDLALAEDRDRIAADLHDTVIQRLFATGLSLQGSLRGMPPEARERIEQAVSDLDETIRQIRTAIFALQPPKFHSQGLRAEILALANEASDSLGFDPHVEFDGPIDSAVGQSVAAELLATLREALANVVRHARATMVRVSVSVDRTGGLTVSVVDDGVGISQPTRADGNGIPNISQRATRLGGNATFDPGPAGRGTALVWSVPLEESGVAT